MPDLVCWVSPRDHYTSFSAVLVDLATVRAAFPGWAVRVAIPTAYGGYLQGEMERPDYRDLGDELCPSTVAGYAALRARFEAAGYPCDTWSVPRGNTPDDRAEGALHGRIAALSGRHYINFEAGWSGFYTEPADVGAENDWLGGYWSTAGDASTGLTWVTNTTMLAAVPNDARRAWIAGTHYDLLEAYVPSDPNIDPNRALNIWAGVLGRLGVTDRPVYLMVERGIVAYVVGPDPVHLWTLESTRAQCLALAADQPDPVPDPTPDPAPEPDYRVALASVVKPDGEIRPALRHVMAMPRLLKAAKAEIAAIEARLGTLDGEFPT